MPLYEYEIQSRRDGELLATLTLPATVEDRDELQLKRKAVPNTVAITGLARNPPSQGSQVLAAYSRLEQRLGTNSEFHKAIGHTPETVKKTWAEGTS